MKKYIIILGLILAYSYIHATTWFPSEIKCPVCDTVNDFQVIGSYGSYIYHWESKLELIYWPCTESSSLYTCKNCWYTAFLWDFDVAGDTLNKIKEVVMLLPDSIKTTNYGSKMTLKLKLASYFYETYKSDVDFWCWYKRVQGHHYDAEGDSIKASKVRTDAYEIARNSELNKLSNSPLKELQLIKVSMNYFNGNYELALFECKEAFKTQYANSNYTNEENSNMNDYYNEILAALEERIIKYQLEIGQ